MPALRRGEKRKPPYVWGHKMNFLFQKYEGCYSVVGAAYATITDLDIFLS